MTLSSSKRWRPVAVAILLVSMSSLSACGLTGDLKRGKPIFGEPNQAVDPAELPNAEKTALPPLPERPGAEKTEEDADDELLGGPGS